MAAGINFLYEEYRKDPKRVEKLLSGTIEISEKLDASRFSVQVGKGRDLKFFKRKDGHITKIDRTLSKYYEKAITHFENMTDEQLDQFPSGWRFGMEYFPNLQPVTISYDRLPLNNLVLTDIQVKDPKDRTQEVITDKDTLFKWATILEVEKPPIIFEGSLTSAQKNRILDFLNTPYTKLIERFKTENFTTFILTLLNPSLKSSFLNNNIEKDIDGLVFKFDGKEALRVSNPEVVLSKAKKKEQKPSDIYNLTLVILQEFMITLDLKKIKLKEKTFEERYIEFISKVFNLFVKTPYYSKNFSESLDFELPRFLTREESGVNFKFVKDEETQDLLKHSNTNRELFKILMASMRTHKKRPSGFFSKELVKYHNELVDKIADYINSNLRESLFSFEEFRSVFIGENSTNWQEFGKDTEEEIEVINEHENSENVMIVESEFPTFSHTIKAQEYDRSKAVLDTLRNIHTIDQGSNDDRNKEVCLMKGKFMPFHKGHLSAIKDAYKESGQKVFLVVTLPRTKNLGISKELHKEMMDSILQENSEICGCAFTDGKSWSEIEECIPSGMKVSSFSGSIPECEDMGLMMEHEVKMIPSVKHLSSKVVEEKIRNEDYDGYKKLVPECLHNYFYKIKSEMK